MTVDAAVLCCCGGPEVECCALTSVVMQIPSIAVNFDFTYQWVDGKTYRRFTTNGTLDGNGAYVQAGFGLTSNLLAPIVLPRRGSNTVDPSFGTLGRCGYQAFRLVQGPSYHGWTGGVVTVESGLLPTPSNSTVWDGRAIPIGQSSANVSYYIRPFRQNGWNQTGAPWAFEAGIVCGGITAGLVQTWPQNGCPIGGNWSTADYEGGFTYYRGKVRSSGSIYGSLTSLTPPTWNQQQAALSAASYPEVAFQITVA